MMNFTELPSVPSDHLVPFTDQLRLAVAAYMARFKGTSRYHTESDLRCYLAWCTERGLDPLIARRPASSCTSGGCRRSAGSSHPQCHGASPSLPGSVVERVRAAEQRAAAQAGHLHTGSEPGTQLVLADRTQIIERTLATAYPTTRKSRATYSGSGYGAGYAQGQQADLGGIRLSGHPARALGEGTQ
jgi:hypothetical protein